MPVSNNPGWRVDDGWEASIYHDLSHGCVLNEIRLENWSGCEMGGSSQPGAWGVRTWPDSNPLSSQTWKPEGQLGLCSV
jgi:hypothetical protein